MSFIKVKDPRKREELVRDFIETRKRIKDNFVARKVGESEYQTGLTKLFKPITETQKATAKEITDAQKATVEKFTSALLPIKEGLENLTVIPPIEEGNVIPPLEMTKELKEQIGKIASEHLKALVEQKPTHADIKSGDKGVSLFKTGKTPIEIKDNDIFINKEKYYGTPGLWKLLTSKDIPNKSEYRKEDLMNYIFIMYDTNTTRANFEKDNNRVGGSNKKMNNLIKPFVKILEDEGVEGLKKGIIKHFGNVEEETDEDEEEYKDLYLNFIDDPKPSTSGKGLKILPSDPNALIDRFDLLFSSKKAGHTGVRNEIVSILDELKRQGVLNVNDYKKLNRLIKK